MDNMEKREGFEGITLTARYLWPSIRTVIAVTGIVCALILFIAALMKYSIIFAIIGPMVVLAGSFIAYFAPMALNTGTQPVIDVMLPTTARDKWAVKTGIFVIIIPVAIQTCAIAVSMNVTKLSPTLTGLNMGEMMPWYYYLCGFFSMMAPSATCLYAVTAYPGKKTKAILMTLGVVLFMFIAGAILGITTSFRTGMECVEMSEVPSPELLQSTVERLTKEIMPLSLALNILVGIFTIFLMRATYKATKNRQF